MNLNPHKNDKVCEGLQEMATRENVHGLCGVLLVDFGIEDRLFARGVRVQVSTDVFHLLLNLRAGALPGALMGFKW